jgi:small-conductance mechanosensitive channel
MVKIPVGVAYGVNVEDIRKLLLDAVKSLETKDESGRDIISASRGINVLFNDFGDNSINLDITFWVLVESQFTYVSKVKEAIYDTLTKHHIEIPYPQRDIYIRQLPKQ